MLRQIYWISIYVILIIAGTLFLDRVAAHGGSHNLIRDMTWPVSSDIACEE